MSITKPLRDNLRYYGITLPIDKRTNAYKEELKQRNIDEKTYVKLLRTQVKKEKTKEQKQIKRIQKETKAQQEYLRAQQQITKKRQTYNLGNKLKPIQIKVIRNKVFNVKPAESAFKSYFKYTIENDRPFLIDRFYNYEKDSPYLTTRDITNFLDFYKVKEYLMNFLNHKVWFSFEYIEIVYERNDEGELQGEERKTNFRSKTKLILTGRDINELFLDYINTMKNIINLPYMSLVYITKLDIHIAKVQTLNGKSYKELPDFIKNKKAIINIKNNDNLCFLYSVLCGLKTPEHNAERVSHYTNRLNELNYKDEDFKEGMSVHKIRFFEKRNNLNINVYSLEEKTSIIPVYIYINKQRY